MKLKQALHSYENESVIITIEGGVEVTPENYIKIGASLDSKVLSVHNLEWMTVDYEGNKKSQFLGWLLWVISKTLGR